MSKKYHIITYGCQMNKSDSERIAGVLKMIGFNPASKENEADLVVVNMCSVRQSAVDRVYGLTQKLKNLKTKKRGLKTILTGCILKKDKRRLKKLCDGIFEIDKLAELSEMLKKLGFRVKKIPTQKAKHYLQIAPAHQSPIIAYMPIMTGCNNFCAYCVVPYLRGREISRPAEEIICEVKNAVKKGVKKIWLLGQNVNSYECKMQKGPYGEEFEAPAKIKMTNQKSKIINFAKLLKMINDIGGNFWIRFTSSHPKDFSDELIGTMAKCQKVTPYLNLPIQSGDDEILKKMNRPYMVKQYKELVKKLRAAFKKYRNGLEKELAVSTDVIVGFPGETKKRFENTKKTFKEISFAAAYVARYSPRPQTAAFRLKDDISSNEKKQREKELTAIVAKTALEFNKQFLNKVVDVLILKQKGAFYFGKTRHHQTIKLKSQKNLLGKFIRAKITQAVPYGLEGKIFAHNRAKTDFLTGNPGLARVPKGSSKGTVPLAEKLIVVLGPTASGKSDLAIKLAKKLDGEVISADSRQVYKGMDIGTGKVTKKEMRGVPHHLLDVVSPKKRFSVVQYQKKAKKIIRTIQHRGKVPILCGGTGFYIQTVIDGIVIPEVLPDWQLRKRLEKKSPEELYQMLKILDPKRVKTIDKKNPRRLIRAIEIVIKTKKPVPCLKKNPLPYPVLIIGIKKEKKELSSLIKKRLLKRLKQGMIAEVKKLKESGLSWKRLEEFGLEYRFVAHYLQNKITYSQMKEILQKEIEHYAKRQMTWFKRDQRIRWITNCREAERLVKNFLKK